MAEKFGTWIPIDKKLPKEGESVLLQDHEGYISLEVKEKRKGIHGFANGDWWTSANNYVAWMPLPEKYTGGD